MTFQPGQSGNPSGRPKAVQDLMALAREHSPAAISRIIGLIHSDDDRVALAAAQVLLDRGYGKPSQALEHSGPEGGPIETKQPDIADLAKTLASVLHKAVEEG